MVSSSADVLVQIMNISSMYLEKVSGLFSCEWRNFVTIVDIYMLAIVGEKAAPIAHVTLYQCDVSKDWGSC